MEDILEEVIKPYAITQASIKEDLCNFAYEVLLGPMAGSKVPNHKGSAMVHQDMLNAFQELEVHLAISVDEFKYIVKKYDSLEKLDSHEIRGLFSVSGFKISGDDENKGFIVIGEKYGTFGSISVESPKITKATNYPFFEQLKESIERVVEEVELYMTGKSAPKEDMPELPFPKEDGDEFNNPQ